MPQPQSCKGDRKACCSGWKRNQLLKHWSFWKFQPQGLAGRASVWVSREDPALPFSLGVSLGSWPSLRRRSWGQHLPQELQSSLRAQEPPEAFRTQGREHLSAGLRCRASLGWPWGSLGTFTLESVKEFPIAPTLARKLQGKRERGERTRGDTEKKQL